MISFMVVGSSAAFVAVTFSLDGMLIMAIVPNAVSATDDIAGATY